MRNFTVVKFVVRETRKGNTAFFYVFLVFHATSFTTLKLKHLSNRSFVRPKYLEKYFCRELKSASNRNG